MSIKSGLWLLGACVVAVVLASSTERARAQGDPGPLGVEFGVLPPAAGAAFPCQVAVRSLVTGERILLEKFSAEPGKEAKFRKSSHGFDVAVDVTIAPGGSTVAYSIDVSVTETKKPLGMYGALLKLHN